MPGETTVLNVPIFPLNSVLFPKMPLSLRIFEERYKRMVQDLPLSGNRFCVALIQDGKEVGGTAEPHNVACLAEVQQLSLLPNGMFLLKAVGIERVKITDLDRTSKPYLTGSVEMWPDGTNFANSALIKNASNLFIKYAHCLLDLSGQKTGKIPAPNDPTMLSYLLATILEIETGEQQRLLQLATTENRLHAEVDILRTELPMLQAIVSSPKPPNIGNSNFSAN